MQQDEDTETITLAEALERLDSSYELIYVSYDDQLTEKQIDALISGDYETLWEETEEFESESLWAGVSAVIDDTFSKDEWDSLNEDEQDEVRYTIQERDSSDWARQLVRQTPNPLCRVVAFDEDEAFQFQAVNAVDVIDVLTQNGFTPAASAMADGHNEKVIADTLLECSPEYSVLLSYYVFSVDLEKVYSAKLDAAFEVTNPYLFLGNPFSGSGYMTDVPLHGTVTVKREDLHTDKSAFGYSVDEIFGGLRASQFEAEIRPKDL